MRPSPRASALRGKTPLLGALVLLSGCAGAGDDGMITITLPFEGGGWFRMRIFDGPVSGGTFPESLFDTGCIEAHSRTFQVTDLPSGAGRSVLFEAFDGADCKPESQTAVGYRGGVTVPAPGAPQPYYHLAIFDEGAMTSLPEDINLSASAAEMLDVCEKNAPCEPKAGGTGRCQKILSDDGKVFEFWCIPTCAQDADCEGIHPQGTCDGGTGWCMMRSPYPLNLSEPRGLAEAASLADGDVLFAGGFTRSVGGVLEAASRNFERFDAGTGLFEKIEPAAGEVAVGLGGFAAVGGDRFVLVGGVSQALVTWSREADVFTLEVEGLCESGCASNLTDQIVVFDGGSGKSVVSHLPGPLAHATVVGLGDGRALVMGGLVPDDDDEDVTLTNDALLCTVGDDLAATCEPAGSLSLLRAGAAASCTDETCESVLVVGGNGGGDAVELVDLSGDAPVFTTLDDEGAFGSVFAPSLCGPRVVGGGDGQGHAGGLAFAALEAGESGVTVTALDVEGAATAPLLPAVARGGDGTCWIAGGLDDTGRHTPSVRFVSGTAVVDDGLELARSRFGAAGAFVTTGPLAGSVVFGGGLALNGEGSGTTLPVRGAEVLRP